MKTRTAYYIAANSETELGGIYGFGIDLDQICFEPQKRSSYLAFSPNRELLYSVSKADVNYASVYRIRENESLEFLDRRPTLALASCHLTTDPAGNFLYCANPDDPSRPGSVGTGSADGGNGGRIRLYPG